MKKVVAYTNRKNEMVHYSLTVALEAKDNEMAKRLKYTKEVLGQLNKNGEKN
jgi:polo-like kinase 1